MVKTFGHTVDELPSVVTTVNTPSSSIQSEGISWSSRPIENVATSSHPSLPYLHDTFASTERTGLHYRGASSGFALLTPQTVASQLGADEGVVQLNDDSTECDSIGSAEQEDEIYLTAHVSTLLLQAFFDDVYPSWPCIFPLVYRSRTCESLLNELQPSLLASMQAMAWTSVNIKHRDIHLPPRRWFLRTAWQQIVAQWPIPGSIVAIQSLILISTASWSAGNVSCAWTTCSMACGMCLDLGLQ